MYTLKKEDLKELLNTWSKSSFDVYAPKENAGQVMLLPYEDDELCLDYINFPFPVKEFLFKQKEILFQWENYNSGIDVHVDETPKDKSILFGIRSCDAYGIAYMDKFFLEDYEDELYKKNREATWIVAVNCVSVGDDCFCSSMGTGPFAREGYDILFTPLEHEYLIEIGSTKGEELIILGGKLFSEANKNLLNEKDKLTEATSHKFKTKIKVNNIAKVLQNNFNDPLWDQLSKECVLCTGCTNLCPTCTCFNVVEENLSCD
ncbi:MAG: hypothetical protein MUO60_00505, partial [Clostridiaceae bacterium]|nr:hypothetical protein [Clostridiaceae bacterium]